MMRLIMTKMLIIMMRMLRRRRRMKRWMIMMRMLMMIMMIIMMMWMIKSHSHIVNVSHTVQYDNLGLPFEPAIDRLKANVSLFGNTL